MKQDRSLTSPAGAIAFVAEHGVVLESGRGPAQALAEAIAGHEIRGSWWGHARGRDIFRATRAVRDSEDVLVCRLINGKITYVHRQLWPALVRLARRVDKDRLAAIREEHTASGAHRLVLTAFPRWVPEEVKRAAKQMSEAEARERIGRWIVEPATREPARSRTPSARTGRRAGRDR